jgi:D-tyrosyl-tRNA(Tyr) deacylase
MRVIIQRVSEAKLLIDNKQHAAIKTGLMVLLGIEDADTQEDINWLSSKIVNLRIFNDENGTMNLSLLECEAEILLVSQFTLFASTKKGNRPSYIKASKPDFAIPLYNEMISALQKLTQSQISTGVFGSDMQIELCNDGPVTIMIDSKLRE